MTSASDMAQIIPTVHRMEMKKLRQKLGAPAPGNQRHTSGMPLSVIFDGSTRLGEGIAIVVRFIDP